MPTRLPLLVRTSLLSCLVLIAGAGCQDVDLDDLVDMEEQAVKAAVAWRRPSAGATLSGTTTLEVKTTGPVAKVVFTVDGILVGSDADGAPWTVAFDTTQVANGAHTLRATALKGSGAQVGAATLQVKVSNTVTEPPPTSPQTRTFTAVADGRVEADFPDTSYAGGDLLVDGQPVMESFVRFSVAEVSGTVTSARLRLFVFNATADGPAVYSASNTWSEAGLTWNTRPARSGAALDDKGAVSAGGWVEFDVTSAVTGNGTFTFALVPTSTDGIDFYSREDTSAPQLVVTTDGSTTCTPKTCAQVGANCGSVSDGCGGTLSCGSCTAPATCGGGGTPNVCGGGSTPTTQIATPANYKVAFVGDTHSTTEFKSVMNLIKNEKAQAVVVLGDMDYNANAGAWYTAVDSILGPSFPVFLVAGNHDTPAWANYVNTYKARLNSLGVTPDDPNLLDEMYSFPFNGLSVVAVGQNGNNTAFANFIDQKLTGNPHIWKICAWHKNQNAMQVGSKTDEMGWGVYENCRKHGAIIATGHEHSYERTKTLTSMSAQTVDGTCSDPKMNCVGPGRTFAFVSGLGGRGLRNQDRCLPTSYPYGCKGEWAKIYATDQGATYGALFITFHINGDPKLAQGQFKTKDGQTIDDFLIRAQ